MVNMVNNKDIRLTYPDSRGGQSNSSPSACKYLFLNDGLLEIHGVCEEYDIAVVRGGFDTLGRSYSFSSHGCPSVPKIMYRTRLEFELSLRFLIPRHYSLHHLQIFKCFQAIGYLHFVFMQVT